MKHRLLSLIVGSIVAGGPPPGSFARQPPAPQGVVEPITLVRPLYPPIAVSARISGQVEVKVSVRSDGSVESAVVMAGPPLIARAAVDAAWQSRFECRQCDEKTTTPYSVIYLFEFSDTPPPEPIRLSASQSRMTVVAKMPLLIPLFSSVSVRSAKCLYLWRCGSHWGGTDYYLFCVRSGRCLWLWKCGYEPRRAASVP